jgi:plastocyanin
MHRLARLAVGTIAIVALAACSSSGGTNGTPGAAASGCTKSTATGTVAAGIKDFDFSPTAITAKVGDVITWTNSGAAQHNPTLDDNSCQTDPIDAAATGSLAFSKAGTFPFHCAIHPSMKGTITITG